MKVAFAHYDSENDVGGVSSWLRRVLPHLKDAGIEVEVHVGAFGGRPGVNCACFEKHGIPFRWRPWIWDTRPAVRRFLAMIEENPPDVYVANSILPAYFAASYARRQGIKTVGTLHSDDPVYHGIVEQFVASAPEFRLTALVTVSRFLEELTREVANQHHVVSRRISYGVPLPEQVAQPQDGVFRLIYTGRLEEEQKRISDVTRALCSVLKKNPRTEVWIVGDGSARSSVEEVIRTSGCDGSRIRLFGRLDPSDIYPVLNKCHALVLLSDYEGLPNSVLEAMAAGVVPVCLDIRSGIREAISPGFNGLIVNNRDEDFCSAIESLQRDTNLWSKLSTNARQTIEDNYSEVACAASWTDLFRTLTAGECVSHFKSPRFVQLPPKNSKIGQWDHRRTLCVKTRVQLGRIRRVFLGPPLPTDPAQ